MDITNVFKACVKAANIRSKKSQNTILPKSKKKDYDKSASFNSRALDVVNGITKFQKFLLQYQSDYLNEYSHVSFGGKMTEEERDEIEENAQDFIKSCSNAINKLKTAITDPSIKGDESMHRTAVMELIEKYHIETSKFYSQLKAFRVKQTIDMKQLSKLKPDIRNKAKKNIEGKAQTNIDSKPNRNKDTKTEESPKVEDSTENSSHLLLLEERKPKDEFKFTTEETQLFQEENDILYNEMNSLVKEIQNIEGKVIEIGQLQEIFHEKVLSQSEQIENVHSTAVTTTENVNEGNEEIRDAIKNSATFRVWILFFLVMCTFSLLFLDWYNP